MRQGEKAQRERSDFTLVPHSIQVPVLTLPPLLAEEETLQGSS